MTREGRISGTTWQELDRLLAEGELALETLREMMRDPPAAIHYDGPTAVRDDSSQNFWTFRVGAQALSAATLVHLHRGDLAHVIEDLQALSAFARLHEEDPGFNWFMIRIAVIGLSTHCYWDALQASGWTEAQLAALQEANRCDRMLSQMARTMAAERIVRLRRLERFGSHSYLHWVNKYEEICQSFGIPCKAEDASPVTRLWRQWVFHPVWRLAWADQEQLIYIRSTQGDIDILREAAVHGSWQQLRDRMGASHANFRPPALSGRFYISLPLSDRLSEICHPRQISWSPPPYPYPDLTRAWFRAMKELTLSQMVSTAIALKRYELRNGRPPATLASLVPEFLPRLPLDYMDGRPLRYQVNASGAVTLYSVGEDGVDNGGVPAPLSEAPGQSADPWTGLDWVWPRPVERKEGT